MGSVTSADPTTSQSTPTLHLKLTGSPYDIGRAHGNGASPLVHRSIKFYKSFFAAKVGCTWDEACATANKFLPLLAVRFPHYLQEMQGIADGAGGGLRLDDVLALNCRTEIAFGLAKEHILSDGCTAFAVHESAGGGAYLAQNWDWDPVQAENIVCLHITQQRKPTIHFMTEAGIIGKIGMNDHGVGVTLNAINATGVDYDKLPCHLVLRYCLDSRSVEQARSRIRHEGVASACHITVADLNGSVGFENTCRDTVEIEMDGEGVSVHSNHLVKEHDGVMDPSQLKDSKTRIARVRELVSQVMKSEKGTNVEALQGVLRDTSDGTCSICRTSTEESRIQTLFSIVMDLKGGLAKVKMGRPTLDGEEFELRP